MIAAQICSGQIKSHFGYWKEARARDSFEPPSQRQKQKLVSLLVKFLLQHIRFPAPCAAKQLMKTILHTHENCRHNYSVVDNKSNDKYDLINDDILYNMDLNIPKM